MISGNWISGGAAECAGVKARHEKAVCWGSRLPPQSQSVRLVQVTSPCRHSANSLAFCCTSQSEVPAELCTALFILHNQLILSLPLLFFTLYVHVLSCKAHKKKNEFILSSVHSLLCLLSSLNKDRLISSLFWVSPFFRMILNILIWFYEPEWPFREHRTHACYRIHTQICFFSNVLI